MDHKYGVTLKANDLKKAISIKNLFETIRAYQTNSQRNPALIRARLITALLDDYKERRASIMLVV
ncbi:MAG: hypothetical protein LBD79_02755 [Treponema sp.]|nr:hypothetical protein [Treponema sp.]